REQRALPLGVADEVAPHRLRDAGQRDVPVDHGLLDQVVVGEGHRPVDHAVDAQLPLGGRDLRQDQGRVNPVELGVRSEERGYPGDAVQRLVRGQLPHRVDLQLRNPGGRGGRGGRGGHARRGRGRGPPEVLAEHQLAAHSGGGRACGGEAGRGEELAPVNGARHRVLLRVPPRAGRSGETSCIGAEARTSHSSAATPARPPMTDGMTSDTWLPGLVIATNATTSVNAATPATPSAAARRAAAPIAIAITAITAYMPSSRTVRPWVPKWCSAKPRSMAGVRSTNTVPSAPAGETVDLSRPAASVETPITT